MPLPLKTPGRLMRLLWTAAVLCLASTSVAALSPKAVRAYDRGLALYREGKISQALEDFDEALKIEPEEPLYYKMRASCYRQLKQYPKAVADYDRALTIQANDSITHNNRGTCLLYMHRFRSALADFDRAVDLDSKYSRAYSNRGFAKISLGKVKDAIPDLERAIQLNPKFAAAYTNLSMAQAELGDYQGALKSCDQAIKLNAKETDAYNNRAVTHTLLGEPEKSIADYDEAIKLNPSDLETRNNRAGTYLALGKPKQAVDDLQAHLNDKSWSSHAAVTSAIYLCVGLAEMDDQVAAQRVLKEADAHLSAKEDWPYPVIQFMQHAISKDQLLETAGDEKKKAEAHFFIAEDLASQGKKQEALDILKEVKETAPKTVLERYMAMAEIDRLSGKNPSKDQGKNEATVQTKDKSKDQDGSEGKAQATDNSKDQAGNERKDPAKNQ